MHQFTVRLLNRSRCLEFLYFCYKFQSFFLPFLCYPLDEAEFLLCSVELYEKFITMKSAGGGIPMILWHFWVMLAMLLWSKFFIFKNLCQRSFCVGKSSDGMFRKTSSRKISLTFCNSFEVVFSSLPHWQHSELLTEWNVNFQGVVITRTKFRFSN